MPDDRPSDTCLPDAHPSSPSSRIEGRAAPLRIENLDTDQIMPKQFLRGIDKSGLARGLLHDLRFDPHGQPRPDFVLNRPQYAGTRILIAGSNFGCGSSREHAVWGLQQFGIQAIVATSFAEIFFSNAMNSRLMLVTLPAEQVQAMMTDADDPASGPVSIDIAALRIRSASVQAAFTMTGRHRRMFLDDLDVIGLSLTHRARIEAFASRHWTAYPWLRDVARLTVDRRSTGQGEPAR